MYNSKIFNPEVEALVGQLKAALDLRGFTPESAVPLTGIMSASFRNWLAHSHAPDGKSIKKIREAIDRLTSLPPVKPTASFKDFEEDREIYRRIRGRLSLTQKDLLFSSTYAEYRRLLRQFETGLGPDKGEQA